MLGGDNLRPVAKEIAEKLLASLRAGEIPKIGADEVFSAIRAAGRAGDIRFERMVFLAVVKGV
jgi:hypothetical protein